MTDTNKMDYESNDPVFNLLEALKPHFPDIAGGFARMTGGADMDYIVSVVKETPVAKPAEPSVPIHQFHAFTVAMLAEVEKAGGDMLTALHLAAEAGIKVESGVTTAPVNVFNAANHDDERVEKSGVFQRLKHRFSNGDFVDGVNFSIVAMFSSIALVWLICFAIGQVRDPWWNAGFEAGRASAVKDCTDKEHIHRCQPPRKAYWQ